MKKRVIGFLCALVMVFGELSFLGCCPKIQATSNVGDSPDNPLLLTTVDNYDYEGFAVSDSKNELTFELDENHGTATFYSVNWDAHLSNVTVPAYVSYNGFTYVVNKIRSGFGYNDDLQEVTVPDTVETIGEKVFAYSKNLRTIRGMKNVTTYGNDCFAETPYFDTLKEQASHTDNFILLNNNTYLYKNLSTDATTLTVPDCVTTIGEGAFQGCSNLKTVSIPSAVTSIQDEAFMDCGNLEEALLPESNNLTHISNDSFQGTKFLTNLYASHDGKLAIFNHILFKYHNDTNIMDTLKVPDDVTTIVSGGLCHMDISSVKLSANVKTIEPGAFFYSDDSGSRNLFRVTVDNNNPYFMSDDNGVLYSKDQTRLLVFPCNNQNIKNYTVPSTVTQIDDFSLVCLDDLDTLDLSCNIEYLPKGFDSWLSDIQNITLPTSLKICTDRELPGSVKRMDLTVNTDFELKNDHPFSNDIPAISKVTVEPGCNITVGPSVTTTDITLPDGETFICPGDDGSKSTSHHFEKGVCTRCGKVCNHTNMTNDQCDDCKLRVDHMTLSANNVVEGSPLDITWTSNNSTATLSYYKDNVLLSSAPTEPGTYTVKLSSVNDDYYLANSVERTFSIEKKVVSSTPGVTSPGAPTTTKTPDSSVESSSTQTLSSVTSKPLANGKVFVINKLMYKVTNSKKKQVAIIGSKDKKIKSLTIGNSVKYKKVVYTITSIAPSAFSKYSKLTKVVIGAKISSIGKQSFSQCKKLKNIVIRTTLLNKKSMGSKCFAQIASSATVTVPKSVYKAYKTYLKAAKLPKKTKIKK